MESSDVFQRNKPKVDETEEVINSQDLMVGLKKENEEAKGEQENESNFDQFVEITDKSREDLVSREITSLFPIQVAWFKDVYDK